MISRMFLPKLAVIFAASGMAVLAQVTPLPGTPTAAPNPPAAVTSAAAPANARLYAARVIHVGQSGAIVECTAPVRTAPGKEPAPNLPVGRFFVREAPASLIPAAEIRFYATEDGAYRYVDFFNIPVTMRALRFVKWEVNPPVARVQPIQTPAGTGAATATANPASKNPTPKLKGTALDEPARRIGR